MGGGGGGGGFNGSVGVARRGAGGFGGGEAARREATSAPGPGRGGGACRLRAGTGGGGGTNGGGGGGGGGAGLGGAVFNDGASVSIINSTFAADDAIGGAGGVALGTGFAGTAGQGLGGAVFSRGGTLVITSATIADNSASAGLFVLGDGSLGGGSAVASVNDTIIAGSLGGAGDVGSATIGGGHLSLSGASNLIQTDPTTGGFPIATTDIVGKNPLLGPLADNGGPTPTMALLAGSPALGKALYANTPLTDQRGAQRGPAGVGTKASPDIGAFEDSSSYLVTTTADAPADGTLRAAVEWANHSTNPALDVAQPNVIVFDTGGAFATAQTVELTTIGDTTVGPTALAITGDVEIDGPTSDGDGVTILAGGSATAMRLFYLAAGASLTLTDLTLSGGVAQGFEGGSGEGSGGGAAGMGGAIYNRGALSIIDSTLTGNQAIGGAGGAGGANGIGGGGGGLVGPGGTPAGGVDGGGAGGDEGAGGSGGFCWRRRWQGGFNGLLRRLARREPADSVAAAAARA